jgi:RHS repeat-associated protein
MPTMQNACRHDGARSHVYKFTGKERDQESNLDMFGARYYGSSLGRFMTPDWAAKPTDVPYASFGNPQSLNLYSYVNNNPTTTRDPDGHDGETLLLGAGAVVCPECALVVLGGVAAVAVYENRDAISQSVQSAASSVSNFFSSDNGKTAPAPQSNPAPRTAQDELPRDANGRPVPEAGAADAAHTQLGTRESRSKPGTSYPQSREFDANGKPVKDIDHTDHGRKDHTNPHQHPYDPSTGKRLPAEPVTPTPPPPPPPPKPPGT